MSGLVGPNGHSLSRPDPAEALFDGDVIEGGEVEQVAWGLVLVALADGTVGYAHLEQGDVNLLTFRHPVTRRPADVMQVRGRSGADGTHNFLSTWDDATLLVAQVVEIAKQRANGTPGA